MAEACRRGLPVGVQAARNDARIGKRVFAQAEHIPLPGDQPVPFERRQSPADVRPVTQCGQVGRAPGQDRLDRPAAQPVFGAAPQPATGCKGSGFDPHAVAPRILLGLQDLVGKVADRAGPKTDQDLRRVFGETLEVAAQAAARRRLRERIARSGEMVEPDRIIAGIDQHAMRQGRLRKALRRPRQPVRDDTSLARYEVRDVRIAEHREPVGPHRDALDDAGAQALLGLLRQAIHEIEIDRPDTGIAQERCRATDILRRLHAPDRRLDLRVERLDAEADPRHPCSPDHPRPVAVEATRIDLDR